MLTAASAAQAHGLSGLAGANCAAACVSRVLTVSTELAARSDVACAECVCVAQVAQVCNNEERSWQ